MKYFFVFSFLLWFPQISIAQNLVENPSFENHEPIDCLSCHHHAEVFAEAMYHWRNLSSHTTICDCSYKRKNNETDYKYFNTCPTRLLSAYDGCNMIQMGYKPNCWDWDHATRGCSSYLGTLLKEKLKMGKKYEVSFWLFIDQPDSPGYAKHIGFSLFPSKIRNPRNALIEQEQFQIDTVIYQKWYQVTWKIQPTCPLQYLVMGVFRGSDGPPVRTEKDNNSFFIDKVSVREIAPSETINNQDVTYFCKPSLNPKLAITPEIDGVNTYFDSGEDQILPAGFNQLDSFAIRAKQYPQIAFFNLWAHRQYW